MNLLFLRGQLPCDRPHSQVTFDTLEENDDMWVQLANKLVEVSNGYGELWYEKGQRVVHYSDRFLERWVPRYAKTVCSFKPDILFARGGFKFMWAEAQRHPTAFKIHYGAGIRVVPKANKLWNLVLVDTQKQLNACIQNGLTAKLWAKPAAENIFKPVEKQIKYDFIYVANWNPNADKGHVLLLPRLNKYRTLHVGINREKWKRKFHNITFTGWIPRKELPRLYAQAKVAVILTRGKDSCPRVIPEALACNTPILVGDTTKIWHEKYINTQTGKLFNIEDFQKSAADILNTWQQYSPREYYLRELSLEQAAKFILACWKEWEQKHA